MWISNSLWTVSKSLESFHNSFFLICSEWFRKSFQIASINQSCRYDVSQICSYTLVADIPGLVEDAHVNKGLGHSFLRHIERCSSLLYVVDLSDGDVIRSFQTLQREVELYNPKLVHLPSAVVANKVDIVENHEARIAEAEGVLSCPVIAISGKHLNNIDNLRSLIRDIYENRLNSLNQRK